MTWEERLGGVQSLGFSERQAGFLTTIMLHSGVCLGRHYCAFAGIAYGQKMHDFFESLLTRRYATVRACGHNKARLYHVHYKPLYRAIGEPDNRHRRPTTLPRAVERLMVLDSVLADRERTWFATERDKLAYFTLTHRIPRPDLPSVAFRADDAETVRYFPDKLPIGVSADKRIHIFLYLLTRDLPVDFRAFLQHHAELWRALPSWTLRLLVPRHMTGAIPLYQAAFHEQLGMPLHPSMREELRWYFRARRDPPKGSNEPFDRAARTFSAPRFRTLYRAWLERGDSVINAALSPVLADAIERRTGQLECYVLPHQYVHLLPLVGTA